MASERVRIEIAFTGGQILGALASEQAVDELTRALADGGVYELEADDGRYVLPLAAIVYVRRYFRETQIGFGGIA